MDLPNGSFVHKMRKTCADKKLKTVVGKTQGTKWGHEANSGHNPEGFFSEGDSDYCPG
jgi:hypothetical protein